MEINDFEKILLSILELRKRSKEICEKIDHGNRKFLDLIKHRHDAIILSNNLSYKMHDKEKELAEHYINTKSLNAPPKLLDEIDVDTEKYERNIDQIEEIAPKSIPLWDYLIDLDKEEKEIDLEVKKLFELLYKKNKKQK